MQIGLISPRLGINLFVLNLLLKDVALSQIFRGVWLFALELVATLALALVLQFPALTLWMPGFMP